MIRFHDFSTPYTAGDSIPTVFKNISLTDLTGTVSAVLLEGTTILRQIKPHTYRLIFETIVSKYYSWSIRGDKKV